MAESGPARKAATRRLMSDYRELKKNPLPGVECAPTDDMFVWHANIRPNKGCHFYGLNFHFTMKFSEDYPRKAPKVINTTKIPHPNVFSGGRGLISRSPQSMHKVKSKTAQNHTKTRKYQPQSVVPVFPDYICLDMLTDNGGGRDGSGWSAAYSVSALMVNLSSFLFDDFAHDATGLIRNILWESYNGKKSKEHVISDLYEAQAESIAYCCNRHLCMQKEILDAAKKAKQRGTEAANEQAMQLLDSASPEEIDRYFRRNVDVKENQDRFFFGCVLEEDRKKMKAGGAQAEISSDSPCPCYPGSGAPDYRKERVPGIFLEGDLVGFKKSKALYRVHYVSSGEGSSSFVESRPMNYVHSLSNSIQIAKSIFASDRTAFLNSHGLLALVKIPKDPLRNVASVMDVSTMASSADGSAAPVVGAAAFPDGGAVGLADTPANLKIDYSTEVGQFLLPYRASLAQVPQVHLNCSAFFLVDEKMAIECANTLDPVLVGRLFDGDSTAAVDADPMGAFTRCMSGILTAALGKYGGRMKHHHDRGYSEEHKWAEKKVKPALEESFRSNVVKTTEGRAAPPVLVVPIDALLDDPAIVPWKQGFLSYADVQLAVEQRAALREEADKAQKKKEEAEKMQQKQKAVREIQLVAEKRLLPLEESFDFDSLPDLDNFQPSDIRFMSSKSSGLVVLKSDRRVILPISIVSKVLDFLPPSDLGSFEKMPDPSWSQFGAMARSIFGISRQCFYTKSVALDSEGAAQALLLNDESLPGAVPAPLSVNVVNGRVGSSAARVIVKLPLSQQALVDLSRKHYGKFDRAKENLMGFCVSLDVQQKDDDRQKPGMRNNSHNNMEEKKELNLRLRF